MLTDEGVDAATEVYQRWESRQKLSTVITLEDVQKTDYNLSPSQFVDVEDKVEHRPLSDILADLAEARIAREKADKILDDVLMRLGLNGRDNKFARSLESSTFWRHYYIYKKTERLTIFRI